MTNTGEIFSLTSQLPSTSSMVATAAVVTAGLYIQSDLTNIKADIEQIKTQLSTTILQVNNKQKIIQLEQTLKVLIEEVRLIKQQMHHQSMMQTMASHPHHATAASIPEKQHTKQDFMASTLDDEYKFVTQPKQNKTMVGDIQTTQNSEIDDDIKTMLADNN